ncbi:MAG: M48 family metallopeptidase [Bacteroidia bacterium]|nr:M48 family metallopeptidase [Bacteroidia bacterium]
MEINCKAKYYSGKSSETFIVDVKSKEDGLLIVFPNQQGKEFFWEKQKIKQIDISTILLTLRYGESFPFEQLEITDRDFISHYKSNYKVGILSRIQYSSLKHVLLFCILLIGIIWSIYAIVVPAITDYAADKFPKEYEIELGNKIKENILLTEKIDSPKTELINHFFNQLHIEKDYPINITVVKSPIVNAFAMPGGGIVVYEGILNGMKSEEQLVALLVHEFSHVQLKHATRNMFRSLAGYLFISIFLGDVSGISAILIQNANELRNLSYSRALETEADNNGMIILKNNKISTNGFVELFELLKNDSNSLKVNEILSTHPDLESRINNTEKFSEEHKYQISKNDSLEFYFKQIQGMK